MGVLKCEIATLEPDMGPGVVPYTIDSTLGSTVGEGIKLPEGAVCMVSATPLVPRKLNFASPKVPGPVFSPVKGNDVNVENRTGGVLHAWLSEYSLTGA